MVERACNTKLGLIGVNHKTLDLSLREQLAQKFDGSSESLRKLAEALGIDSCVVISTCNRFEVVFTPVLDQQELLESFKSYFSLIVPDSCFYLYYEEPAYQHFYRVVSGLDSMVLGEPQITGQIKQAYDLASETLALDKYLHRLFQTGFRVAKTIRTHTSIAREAVSVSFVAVKLAEKIFGNLKQSKVLLLGSGEIAELCGLHLKARGARQMYIANRTRSRAQALCDRFGAAVVNLEDVSRLAPDMDIVIGSLRIDKPIFELANMRGLSLNKPLFMIDLGVPRNFQAAIGDLDNIFLYNIDDLSEIASANKRLRNDAAKDAGIIIDYAVHSFSRWIRKVVAEPNLLDFRQKVFQICKKELGSSVSSLNLEKAVYRISQKLAHELQGHYIEDTHEDSIGIESLFEPDPLRLIKG